MRALLAAAVISAVGLGCATVRITKRDGCWVKQTETFPKTIHEEIGPCVRAPPTWSNDRVARLVQECLAQADYRWQTEALDAWTRGKPLPMQKSEQSVMDGCLGHAATSLVTENEALKKRVAELDGERANLTSIVQQERAHWRDAENRMTDALGEAAKKPAPAAFATANSNGSASTQSDQTAQSPPVPVIVPTQPVPIIERVEPPKPAPAPQSSCTRDPKAKRKAGAQPACPVPPLPFATHDS
jgi:hypothetical protein